MGVKGKDQTPIFDALVSGAPDGIWRAAPKVFPSPAHQSECPFDGYNWEACICGHYAEEEAE